MSLCIHRNPQGKCQKCRVEAAQERLDEKQSTAMDALKELVRLKDLKDRDGKTPEYLRDQPKAWKAARTIIGQE